MSETRWPIPRIELSVEQALNRIEALVAPTVAIESSLSAALGTVLQADVFAPFDLPRYSNSAMDGFAVRSVDTELATPDTMVTLEVIGSVEAGQVGMTTAPIGSAIRIGTGAAIPGSCNAVVPIEDAVQIGSFISLAAPVARGANIRPRGEDIRAGELAIAAGNLIRPQEIAMLAALGIEHLRASPRPRVSVVSIGPELSVGAEPTTVPDANGPMLASLAQVTGANLVHIGKSAGDPSALITLLHELANVSDLIITSGGISDGAADTLSRSLTSMPAMELWNIRLRPGKHFAAGRIRSSVLLALPGNPVAAFVGFLLLGRRTIELTTGKRRSLPAFAIATEPLKGSLHRVDALRGFAETGHDSVVRVTPTAQRGSGIVSSLLEANCLILLPEDIDQIDAGEPVEIRWVEYQ